MWPQAQPQPPWGAAPPASAGGWGPAAGSAGFTVGAPPQQHLKRERSRGGNAGGDTDDDDDDDSSSLDDAFLPDDSDGDTAMGGGGGRRAAAHERVGPRAAKMPYQRVGGSPVSSSFAAPRTYGGVHAGATPTAWGTAPQMLPSGAIATPLQPMGAWVVTSRLLPPPAAPATPAPAYAALSVFGGGGSSNTRVPMASALPPHAVGLPRAQPLVAVAVLDLASAYCLHLSLHALPLPGGAAPSPAAAPAAAAEGSGGARVGGGEGGSYTHAYYAQGHAAPRAVVQLPVSYDTGPRTTQGRVAQLPVSYVASAQFVAQLAALHRSALGAAADAAVAAVAPLLGPHALLAGGGGGGGGGGPASSSVPITPALVLSELDAEGFSWEVVAVLQLQQQQQAQSIDGGGGGGGGGGRTAATNSPVGRFWAEFYGRFGALLGVHGTTSSSTSSASSESAVSAALTTTGGGLMSLLAGLQTGLAASLAHHTALPLPLVLGPGYGCSGRPCYSLSIWELLHHGGGSGGATLSPAGVAAGSWAPLSIQPPSQHQQHPFPRASSPVSPFEVATATIAGRLGAVHLSRGGGGSAGGTFPPPDGSGSGSGGPALGGGPSPPDTALPSPRWGGDSGQCSFPTPAAAFHGPPQPGAAGAHAGAPLPASAPPQPPVTDRAVAAFAGQWNVRGDVPPGPPALALPPAQAQVAFSRLQHLQLAAPAPAPYGGGGGGGARCDSPHVRLSAFFERLRPAAGGAWGNAR